MSYPAEKEARAREGEGLYETAAGKKPLETRLPQAGAVILLRLKQYIRNLQKQIRISNYADRLISIING
jgi:hypothetical protein